VVLPHTTVKFRKEAPELIFFKGPFRGAYFWKGLIFGGVYCRREINVSKLVWLIIGGKFVSKFLNVQLVILEVLARNS